jgi:thioredoxin-dependent peroxiredoxin
MVKPLLKPVLISVLILMMSGQIWAKPLKVGSPAPVFSAPSHKAPLLGLEDFKGKPLIVVFYPADFTPGCTVQLCSLRDHYDRVKAAGAEVLAINSADVASHKSFAQKHHLPFHVLADQNNRIAKAFGVGNMWGFNTRTVFVLDETGHVIFRDEGMPSVDTLLNVIQHHNAR